MPCLDKLNQSTPTQAPSYTGSYFNRRSGPSSSFLQGSIGFFKLCQKVSLGCLATEVQRETESQHMSRCEDCIWNSEFCIFWILPSNACDFLPLYLSAAGLLTAPILKECRPLHFAWDLARLGLRILRVNYIHNDTVQLFAQILPIVIFSEFLCLFCWILPWHWGLTEGCKGGHGELLESNSEAPRSLTSNEKLLHFVQNHTLIISVLLCQLGLHGFTCRPSICMTCSVGSSFSTLHHTASHRITLHHTILLHHCTLLLVAVVHVASCNGIALKCIALSFVHCISHTRTAYAFHCSALHYMCPLCMCNTVHIGHSLHICLKPLYLVFWDYTIRIER